jgi:hypothetical protein
MFHPGKVLRVYSQKDKDIEAADNSTQALVRMWDENLFTVNADPSIAAKLREEDIVLIDYNPAALNFPSPKMLISKILRGETAKKTWKIYEEHFKMVKERSPTGGTPGQAYIR